MFNSVRAIVLAAGKGTRLQTEGCDLPKVMRLACERPLLSYVLDGLSFIEKQNTCIVVGYKKEFVTAAFPEYSFAEQVEQLGTGHAVMAARSSLIGFDGDVLVCCGDMPLITGDTYRALVEMHISDGNDCTMLTSASDTPLPYGRIVRDSSGAFVEMVEDKDCTEEQRRITELNSGVYVFKAQLLLQSLEGLRSDNAQGEYYLTDVPAIMRSGGAKIGICMCELGSEIIGVNTSEQLCEVEEIIRGRIS